MLSGPRPVLTGQDFAFLWEARRERGEAAPEAAERPAAPAFFPPQAGLPEPENAGPPYHLGKCIAWDFDGPVVQRHYPKFAGWQPLKRKA